MNKSELQAKIDAIKWYHEFDFGNGLKAVPDDPELAGHRIVWDLNQTELDKVSFQGKSVLDIGCWDGYWSFYAEKRGASSILAVDDFTQNWASADGIFLAKDLLKSKVEINPRLSVYDIANLNRKFDVVLFLGVYYHLWDPFYALSQIRHCCHANTVLVMSGAIALQLPPYSIRLCYTDARHRFTPTVEAVRELLTANYFRPCDHISADGLLERRAREAQMKPAPMSKQASPGKPTLLSRGKQVLRRSRSGLGKMLRASGVVQPRSRATQPYDTAVFHATAFEGKNEAHLYKPPFGLHAYDPRYRNAA